MSRPKSTVKFNKDILKQIQEYADIIVRQEHLEEKGEHRESDELYFDRQLIERYLAEYIVKALNIKGKV